MRWKVASDLRFRAAIPELEIPSFCEISGDLALSTWKSLAIAIVRFCCAISLSCDAIFVPLSWLNVGQELAKSSRKLDDMLAKSASSRHSDYTNKVDN